MARKPDFDVIIIGAGPAGLAAAVYTGRDRFSTLVLEQMTVGGQVATTWDVENYPGFAKITGPELVEKFEEHARTFGAEIRPLVDVTSLRRDDDGLLVVVTPDGELTARALLVATGASWNKLGIPGEDEYRGKGVSYCATCDGAFYKGRHVMVVGGGNTALDEGFFLTRFASKVTLVHRRDQLRGDKIVQEHFQASPATEIIWNSVASEIRGDGTAVRSVLLTNKVTGETTDFPVDGVFIFVGTSPNTAFLEGVVDLDRWKGVVIDRSFATSLPGVFAAGDCCADAARQIATAAGDGVHAALSIKAYLEKGA